MNPTAIYSKSGKGVQEASGKTSLLKRPDRAILSAIDGRATLADVAQKVGRTFDAAFQGLITQLDKDGFIREVSAGAAAAAPAPAAKAPPPKAAPPRPGAKPAPPPADDGGDLDFSALGPAKSPPPRPAAAPPPPPAAKEQQSALNKAREEAEAKAQAERERARKEAEAKARAELEAKAREEAEKKLKEESDAKLKAMRDAALRASEAKVKVEAEAKAKLEIERKAREETERKLEEAKKEAERARKEGEEAEKKGKEEADRARREVEEERKRLEADRKREDEERAARRKKEDEEEQARRKQKEEEERKAEEERAARRKQKEEEERKAEEERAAQRKKREEEEAAREREEQAKREAARKKREEEQAAREREEEAKRESQRAAAKKKREEEEAERERAEEARRAEEKRKREEERQRAEAETAAAASAAAAAPKAQPKKEAGFDSLLADLDSFGKREEEEQKAQAEAERKAKAEAERREEEKRRAESERKAKEESDKRRREEEEARRKEEEARRAREEEEQEERRKRDAEEIKRKAAAATAAAMAKQGKAPAKDDDIPVGEEDLDMDEVKSEEAALKKGKPKERAPEKKPAFAKAPSAAPRGPSNLGRNAALALLALLVVGIGVLHVMPLGTADFERAATEALGRPVKIGSAKLWLLTGLELRFQDVQVGDAKIARVAGAASFGSITGPRKEFSRLDIEGLSLPQAAVGDALFATVRSDNFAVERIHVRKLELPGPAVLPKNLDADLALDAKGTLRSATVRGPDGLVAKLAPSDSSIEFELTAAGFTLPIAPQVTLSQFVMKGKATPRGMTVSEWGGQILGGGMSGTANVRWGGTWNVDGVITVRNINAAVFAPALLSEGNAEGTGKFTMNAPDPAGLVNGSRIDGNFKVNSGVLGSFDLARGIQSGGKQFAGRTQFVEMNGQGSYDRGAVALRNVTIGAGALNAGVSADISQSGALSGRIVADMKTAAQTLRATLLLGGTVREPQVRN